MKFTHWQAKTGYGHAPYNKNSPNLMEIYKHIKAKFPAVTQLGCFGVRMIKSGNPNETTISTHAFGAADDIGCSTDLSLLVIQEILNNYEVFHIQMIVDYKRRRIWKCDRVQTNNGWKASPDLHSGGGSWIHVETNEEGWNDSTQISERLDGTPQRAMTLEEAKLTNLQLGSTNVEAVIFLQQGLNNFQAGLKVDGAFGPKTDMAVRGFQTVHKLTVDGKVGPQTWSSLYP